MAAELAARVLDRRRRPGPAGTAKPSVTSLKWWISDSIDWPMILRTCSSELPIPSEPIDSCAGQAIFASCDHHRAGLGEPLTACFMILSDSCISASRSRYRA